MSDSDKVKVVLYYAIWCPHCALVKPIFDNLQKIFENNSNVEIKTIEDSQIKTMTEKPDISGYPTIMIGKGDKMVEFDKRDEESLVNKINSLLESQKGGNQHVHLLFNMKGGKRQMDDELMYKQKYIKYKAKYLKLINSK